MGKKISFLLWASLSFLIVSSQEIYVNTKKGNNGNSGTKQFPLKTIGEAAKRINESSQKESATIILSDGVYALTEAIFINNNKFSSENRLTIRAEVLPGDTDWTPQKMPIITSVIPTNPTPGDGEEARGFEFDVSHVTIAGLRFTGSPVYYYIKGFQNRRYYPIWRDGKNLDDLVVTQCLFAGNVDVMPIRVAVIANGNGLAIDHCVFFNCQNTVVFWDAVGGTSYHNVMHNCLVYENNYSGVWTTASTANDFEFYNNIIANSRTGWIKDKNSTHNYQIHDCIFANNTKFAGNGGDVEINADFLKMNNVQLTGHIEIEKDQGKLNYLQLKEGSFGSELNAGLFKK